MADNAATLGIVAGSGDLPRRLIEACRAAGRPFFVLALEGEADPTMLAEAPHAWCRIGEFAKGFELLRANRVGELVLAGGVKRLAMSAWRPDWRAAKFLARIGLRALGDDGLLSAVIKELEREGFAVIGAERLLDESAVMPEGPIGALVPDPVARADIERGFTIARAIGALDIGQSVVVQQGMVLGVEAIEGTDALLRRCGGLRREGPGGVLVKIEKPGQERRVDRPVIGPQTVAAAADAGLRGIAAQAGSVLILDRDAVAQGSRCGGGVCRRD